MSFRVWFLRMVWVIAAAVALSGCDTEDDDNKEGTETNDSGPSLAIGTIGDVTMGDGGESAAITVSIASDADADKTAEVTLTVACGDEEAVEKKMKAKAGKADFGDIDLGDHGTAVECTANASATLGGEKIEAKEVEFEIKAASDGDDGTPTLTLAIHDDNGSDAIGGERAADAGAVTEGTVVWAKVMVTGSIEGDDLSVSWSCVDNSNIDAGVGGVVNMGTGTNGEYTASITLDDSSNELADSSTYTCTVAASINDESGSEVTETIDVTGAAG